MSGNINILGLNEASSSAIRQKFADEGLSLVTAPHYTDSAWISEHLDDRHVPAFWWRYSQPFQRLLAEVRKGTIGDILAIKVKTSIPSSLGETICPSGADICGIVADSPLTTHRVSRPTPLSEHSILELKYASGVFASSVQVTHTGCRPPSLHLRVVGTTGILQAELYGPMIHICSDEGWLYQPYIQHPIDALWAARTAQDPLFPTMQQALDIALILV